MRRSAASLFLAVLCAGGVTASAARAQDKTPDNRRTISVTGQGEVTASPDLVIITLAVETTAPTAAAAVNENAKRSAALVSSVKERVGKEDKVTTARYTL